MSGEPPFGMFQVATTVSVLGLMTDTEPSPGRDRRFSSFMWQPRFATYMVRPSRLG